MSGTHTRTLINVVSSSLSPNADPDSATRAETPTGVVTVQSSRRLSSNARKILGRPVCLKSRAETGWIREVVPPLLHQECLGNAPATVVPAERWSTGWEGSTRSDYG